MMISFTIVLNFHVDAVCEEVILQAGINLVAFLGSEVTDRAFALSFKFALMAFLRILRISCCLSTPYTF